MFCPKCGKENDNNCIFCGSCGTKLSDYVNNNSTPTINVKKDNELFKNIKSFFINYKKQMICIVGLALFIFIVYMAYDKFIGFKKIEWNKEYDDYKLDYVIQNEISLGLNVSSDEQLKDLKIKTNCGTYERNDLEINWDLSDALGECKIDVSYKAKKISKTFNVISKDIVKKDYKELTIKHEINYDSDEDLDKDGLTNKQEKEYKTDPELSDSDMDGLTDYYEINNSKTDPNNDDTDSDGIGDYDELELGLDPLKSDSKGDGKKDSDRDLVYSFIDDKNGIELEISGKGNIVSTYANTYTNDTFSAVKGFLPNVYNFYTKGNLNKAVVKIKYSTDDINNKKLNEDSLSLYYFNDETKKIEKINTTVDKQNKQLSAELSHFSKYIIGDSTIIKDINKTQIMMVIDNSVSMYSYEQLENAGFTGIQNADGNDTNFKRLSLTNDLIDMFTGNYYFGISHFAGNYIRIEKFTDNTTELKKSVDSLKYNLKSLSGGTDIVNALNNSIKEFDNDDNNHYVILLTDGKDTSRKLKNSRDSIISNAKEKNIKLCVIGLGKEIDTEDLSYIAKNTGCNYYNATDATALDEIYSIIGSDINYNLVDVDGDKKTDGTLIADSGFIVTRDGFSFPNYSSNLAGGHCYGMATFVEMYYLKQLPVEFGSKTIFNGKYLDPVQSYPYNFSGTYFEKYSNLYDYKLKSNVLKYNFGYDYFEEEVPKDFRKIDGDNFILNDKYKKEMQDSNLYDFEIKDSSLTPEEQLKKWGVNYEKSENIIFNEDKMQESSTIKNEDKQLLNAIYMAYIKQDETPRISSSFSIMDVVKDGLNLISPGSLAPSKKVLSNVFIENLSYRIQRGDVPVISAEFYGSGGHAINAISIAQDNKDASHYYIGVYDNNFPGEKRYVDLVCNKFSCVTKKNSYYDGDKKQVSMSESLIEDFKYYNLNYVEYVKNN